MLGHVIQTAVSLSHRPNNERSPSIIFSRYGISYFSRRVEDTKDLAGRWPMEDDRNVIGDEDDNCLGDLATGSCNYEFN